MLTHCLHVGVTLAFVFLNAVGQDSSLCMEKTFSYFTVISWAKRGFAVEFTRISFKWPWSISSVCFIVCCVNMTTTCISTWDDGATWECLRWAEWNMKQMGKRAPRNSLMLCIYLLYGDQLFCLASKHISPKTTVCAMLHSGHIDSKT